MKDSVILTEVDEASLDAEMPEGWAVATLEDIGDLYCGQSPGTEFVNAKRIGTPYITGPDQWNGNELHVDKWTTDPRRTVPEGCIFVTVKGAGVGTIFPGVPGAIGRDIYAFKPAEEVPDSFVRRALEFTVSEIKANAAGDIPGLSKDHLLKHRVNIPPCGEQKRILAAIDKLFEAANSARGHLSRVPAILKRFRQAVLAAACSGRLTEDWREGHPEVKSAIDLLCLIEKDGKRKNVSRQNTAANQLDEEPFELPNTWAWTWLSEVCSSVTDGDHQPPPKAKSGVPFLVISNINKGKVDMGSTMFVPHDYYERISPDRKARMGDILYSVTGSFGIPAIVDTDTPFCFQRHIALLRPHSRISSRYLFYLMASDLVYRQASSVATGIAQLTVPLSGLRSLRIPLPPAEEQGEIARRVDKLLQLADTVNGQVSAASLRCTELPQSILAKAFRGELVPTEAELARREGRDYEPASVLLERIKKEREEQTTSKPKQPRKRQKAEMAAAKG